MRAAPGIIAALWLAFAPCIPAQQYIIHGRRPGGVSNNCTTGANGTFRLFLTTDGADAPSTGSYTTHATREFPASISPETVGDGWEIVANTDGTRNDPLSTGSELFKFNSTGNEFIELDIDTTGSADLIFQPGESMCVMVAGYQESSSTSGSDYIWAFPPTYGSFTDDAAGTLLNIRANFANSFDWTHSIRMDSPSPTTVFMDAEPILAQFESFIHTFYAATDCNSNPCTVGGVNDSEWGMWQDTWDISGPDSFGALTQADEDGSRNDITQISIGTDNLAIGDNAGSTTNVYYLGAFAINVCASSDNTCQCMCDPGATSCSINDWGTLYFTDGKINCEAAW